MSEPTPFERALADAAAGLPPGVPTDAVERVLHEHRERLAGATGLGNPTEAGDLYQVADTLAAAMREVYPGIKCRQGCSGCCETPTAVFDATAREWDAIERHLTTAWEPGRLEALVGRFVVDHGPRLWAYRVLGWLGHFEPIADRYFARAGYVCPFLEGGACSIYPVRPLACRMYGHHATGGSWRRKAAVYGCRLQADYFETVLSAGRLRLPSAEAVWAKARRLTREAPWRWSRHARILPLWLAGRLAGGYIGKVPTLPAPPP